MSELPLLFSEAHGSQPLGHGQAEEIILDAFRTPRQVAEPDFTTEYPVAGCTTGKCSGCSGNSKGQCSSFVPESAILGQDGEISSTENGSQTLGQIGNPDRALSHPEAEVELPPPALAA